MPASPRLPLAHRRRRAAAFLTAAAIASVTLTPSLLSPSARADEKVTPPASAATAAAKPSLVAQLDALEKEMEADRAKIGVPGMSVVIVQNDKVILLKGLGMRHVEKKLPVTPDTLFAIGSSTKAFTGMSVG